jgi:hypothetical protein
MKFTAKDFEPIVKMTLEDLQFSKLAEIMAEHCNRKMSIEPKEAPKAKIEKLEEALKFIARHDALNGYPTSGEWVQMVSKVMTALR